MADRGTEIKMEIGTRWLLRLQTVLGRLALRMSSTADVFAMMG